MATLQDVYKDAPYEVRLKARIFSVVLWLLMAVYAGFCALLVGFSAIGASLVIFAVQLALLVLAMVWLRTGKYDHAARLAGLSLVFLLWLGNVTNPATVQRETIAVAALGYASMFLVMTLFLRDRRVPLIAAPLVVVLFAAQIVIQAPALTKGLEGAEAMSNLVSVSSGAAIFLVFLLVVGITIQQVFIRISADLYRELAEMEASRARSREVMQQVSKSLDQSAALQSAAAETAAGTVEIEQNLHTIKDRIRDLNAGFQSTEQSFSAIQKDLESLVSLVGEQTTIASSSSSAVEEMVASIHTVTGIIDAREKEMLALDKTAEEGSRSMNETTRAFQEVVGQIQKIKEMITLIQDIASQTNLLAMNAAIEAAHAGESGRGFSVVATEIRKLAESSAHSATTIDQNLKALQQGVEATSKRVQASGKAFEEVQHGVALMNRAMAEIASSTGEMNTGTAEILSSTASLGNATTGVDRSTQSLSAAYRQILGEIRHISDIIGEISSGMTEIGEGTSQIRLAMSELSELAHTLKEQTATLHSAAEQ